MEGLQKELQRTIETNIHGTSEAIARFNSLEAQPPRLFDRLAHKVDNNTAILTSFRGETGGYQSNKGLYAGQDTIKEKMDSRKEKEELRKEQPLVLGGKYRRDEKRNIFAGKFDFGD